MSTLLLRNIAAIHACDDSETVIPGGYLYVRDGQIAALGREPCSIEDVDEVHDLSGCVVLPGMVNVHHHFFQSLTRAVPRTQRAHALDWLYGLYPLWAELDQEAMYWASALSSAELLLGGATTSADHSYLLPGDAAAMAEAQFRASADTGLRLHLVHGCLPTLEADLIDRLRPVMGDGIERLIDREETMFGPMQVTIQRFHDAGRGAMTRVALGPTGITYARPDLMNRIANLAAENSCGLHTHYHPRQVERDLSLRLCGQTPLSLLQRSGWLRPGTWFAHCTEINDEEIAAFADAGCGVAHCPRTIIRLGYQVAPITAMRRAGIALGIGVDGSASNDSSSMINEVRLAHLLHRIATPPQADPMTDWMSPAETLMHATRDGARILGRNDIGELSVGKCADIAAFRIDGVDLAGNLGNSVDGLLLAGSQGRATMTICNGRIVVKDGKLVTMDEARIANEANRHALTLAERAERSTNLRFC